MSTHGVVGACASTGSAGDTKMNTFAAAEAGAKGCAASKDIRPYAGQPDLKATHKVDWTRTVPVGETNPHPSAACVCRITTSVGVATGFHYGCGWVVTNSHVVQSHEDLKQCRFEFSQLNLTLTYQQIDCFLTVTMPEAQSSKYPDMMFVRFKALEAQVSVEAHVDGVVPTSVCVLHHGHDAEGKHPLQISKGKVVSGTKLVEAPMFIHDAQTRFGSSGAPVFSIPNAVNAAAAGVVKASGAATGNSAQLVGLVYGGDPTDGTINVGIQYANVNGLHTLQSFGGDLRALIDKFTGIEESRKMLLASTAEEAKKLWGSRLDSLLDSVMELLFVRIDKWKVKGLVFAIPLCEMSWMVSTEGNTESLLDWNPALSPYQGIKLRKDKTDFKGNDPISTNAVKKMLQNAVSDHVSGANEVMATLQAGYTGYIKGGIHKKGWGSATHAPDPNSHITLQVHHATYHLQIAKGTLHIKNITK